MLANQSSSNIIEHEKDNNAKNESTNTNQKDDENKDSKYNEHYETTDDIVEIVDISTSTYYINEMM